MNKRDNTPLPRILAGAIGLLLVLTCAGCAIYYRNSKTGSEHVWGLGQLRLKVEPISPHGQLSAVSSGCRLAGIFFEAGREHFGITFGYLDRQKFVVVSTNQVPELQPPATARWKFGHLRMRGAGSPANHQAIVTGKALAGLGLCAGGGDTSVSFALDSRQVAVVQDEDIYLRFDQDAPAWPGFDFFAAKVEAMHSTEATQTKGEP